MSSSFNARQLLEQQRLAEQRRQEELERQRQEAKKQREQIAQNLAKIVSIICQILLNVFLLKTTFKDTHGFTWRIVFHMLHCLLAPF